MSAFHVSGISADLAADVRTTMRSPQYGHPAHREVASGYGPCRLCLRTFREGEEERILFTYQPFEDSGSIPAPGPVFIHAEPCDRYDASSLPPELERLPLVFESYAAGGVLLRRERVGDDQAASVLERLMAATMPAYVHVRNGEAGCFIARIEPRKGDTAALRGQPARYEGTRR